MNTTTVQPNRQLIAEHLAALHQCAEELNGLLALAGFGEDPITGQALPPLVEHFSIGEVEPMTDLAVTWSAHPHRNVYAPLVVMRPDLPTGEKGGERDIVKVLGLVADFDDAHATLWATRLPIQPTATLETSLARVQCISLFSVPMDPGPAKDLARRLQAHTRCDFGSKDISHVWRLAGTLNWPNKKKADAGRSPEPFLVMEIPGGTNQLIDPAALENALPALAPPVNRTPPRPAQTIEIDDQTLIDKMLNATNGSTVRTLWAGDWHPHPSQSEADMALCIHLAFWCRRDKGRIDRLFRQSGLFRDKWDTRRGDSTYGANTISLACANCPEILSPTRHARAVATRADTSEAPSEAITPQAQIDQPELDCDIGDLDEITRRAWDAIGIGNRPPQLFRYGSRPSRIELDEDGHSLRIVELTADRLRHHAAHLVGWSKTKGQSRVECRPPIDVINNMLAAPDIPLPLLSRIVEVPVFSHRGCLVQHPGYDAEAQLYYQPYAPTMTTLSVPAKPTNAEVVSAKARLDDLLGDFPFVSTADQTHAIALALVPFVRLLIDGPVPLHATESPSPGSGKKPPR